MNGEVEFFAEDVDMPSVPQDKIRRWIFDLCNQYQRHILFINYIFCSDEYLLSINESYLEHHDYTDIITFDYGESAIESDVFISVDRIKENAIEFNQPEEREFLRIIAHGCLHLIGYKDKTTSDKNEMTKAENDALDLYDQKYC